MEYFTPIENLLNQTARQPNKVFLHQPINRQWQEFTWADVEDQSRRIAAALIAQGFKEGTRIGILSKNCAHWGIVDLAIMMAGMISIPIYATANRKTIDYVIKHADLKAIFVGKLDNLEEAEVAIKADVLRISLPYPTISAQQSYTSWLTSFSPLIEINHPTIDDIATIMYTSGSTGTPKGVVWSHKNWAAAAQCTSEKFEMTSSSRVLSYLPLAHAVERSLAAAALYKGYQVFFAESLDTFIEDLQYAKPTAFGSVPRLWTIFQSRVLSSVSQKKLDRLLSLPFIGHFVAKKIRSRLGLQYATHFCSGTAPIPLSLLQWYGKIGINIAEGWGMTETSSLSCINLPFLKNNLGTIGSPLACVEMKLSEKGEILIRGDAVFSNYYLDQEGTTNAFVDGWFHTGDCAVNDSGVYKINGRIKDKFKTAKGKYVTPVPIESLLCANANIGQVCVVGSGLKQPIALIVLNETLARNRKDAEITKGLYQTLLTVNNQLESHQKLDLLLICKDTWSIDNDLLTPTMKIKRNVIEEKYNNTLTMKLSGEVIWEEDII
ncbi:MAG: AMP-binding protein [Colwellia sp.]|nr:AMP-binding protein [Colwellia sp.]